MTAQTITEEPRLPSIDYRCPSWCVGPQPCDWEAEAETGRPLRGHCGPSFGEGPQTVTVIGEEYGDALGAYRFELCGELDLTRVELSAETGRTLAANLVAAAEWLEEQR
jgi:hypothetical protein